MDDYARAVAWWSAMTGVPPTVLMCDATENLFNTVRSCTHALPSREIVEHHMMDMFSTVSNSISADMQLAHASLGALPFCHTIVQASPFYQSACYVSMHWTLVTHSIAWQGGAQSVAQMDHNLLLKNATGLPMHEVCISKTCTTDPTQAAPGKPQPCSFVCMAHRLRMCVSQSLLNSQAHRDPHTDPNTHLHTNPDAHLHTNPDAHLQTNPNAHTDTHNTSAAALPHIEGGQSKPTPCHVADALGSFCEQLEWFIRPPDTVRIKVHAHMLQKCLQSTGMRIEPLNICTDEDIPVHIDVDDPDDDQSLLRTWGRIVHLIQRDLAVGVVNQALLRHIWTYKVLLDMYYDSVHQFWSACETAENTLTHENAHELILSPQTLYKLPWGAGDVDRYQLIWKSYLKRKSTPPQTVSQLLKTVENKDKYQLKEDFASAAAVRFMRWSELADITGVIDLWNGLADAMTDPALTLTGAYTKLCTLYMDVGTTTIQTRTVDSDECLRRTDTGLDTNTDMMAPVVVSKRYDELQPGAREIYNRIRSHISMAFFRSHWFPEAAQIALYLDPMSHATRLLKMLSKLIHEQEQAISDGSGTAAEDASRHADARADTFYMDVEDTVNRKGRLLKMKQFSAQLDDLEAQTCAQINAQQPQPPRLKTFMDEGDGDLHHTPTCEDIRQRRSAMEMHSEQMVKMELTSYVNAACMIQDSNTNGMDWWKLHSLTNPGPVALARMYLGLRPTVGQVSVYSIDGVADGSGGVGVGGSDTYAEIAFTIRANQDKVLVRAS
ncbi:hypothetical protein SARC_02737, partial [Sphaeroforma arctica JP610]